MRILCIGMAALLLGGCGSFDETLRNAAAPGVASSGTPARSSQAFEDLSQSIARAFRPADDFDPAVTGAASVAPLDEADALGVTPLGEAPARAEIARRDGPRRQTPQPQARPVPDRPALLRPQTARPAQVRDRGAIRAAALQAEPPARPRAVERAVLRERPAAGEPPRARGQDPAPAGPLPGSAAAPAEAVSNPVVAYESAMLTRDAPAMARAAARLTKKAVSEDSIREINATLGIEADDETVAAVARAARQP